MSDVAPHTKLRCIHLCSGYGGFELGFKLAGIDAKTVAHVERDTYAAATLVARMAEKNLDPAPIWDDLSTFNSEPWRGRVDCITAGFPCQPFSNAGAKKGINDDRWLWPAIKRIVRGVGPRFVFLENVPGLVRGGLPFVLSDLTELGFDAEWGLHSAAEVGAPHKRERFWLLAYAPSFDEREPNHEERAEPRRNPRPNAGGNGEQLGYASGGEPAEVFSAGDSGPDVERASGRSGIKPAMADTASGGRSKDRGYDGGDSKTAGSGRPSRNAGWGDTHSKWPPARDGNWADYIAKGGPEPSIRRGTDGPPEGLADSLHLGGNGLVPAVAAAAFVELLNRHQH